MNPNDLLQPNGDTIKYSQWNEGDKVQGVLTATPRVVPHTDFHTKEQKKSKNGNLLWQFKLSLDVDGENKTLYVKDAAYWETLNAFKAAGLRNFEDAVGGTYALKRVEDTPSTTVGFNAKKNYKAAFKAAQ